MDNKRSIGAVYEKKAEDFLKDKGYDILQKNFRCKMGEIDIIARKNDVICFVEVKYRKSASYGHPEEAVSYYKQEKIRKVAEFYFLYHKIPLDTECSFDVIAVEGEEIRHIRNAF